MPSLPRSRPPPPRPAATGLTARPERFQLGRQGAGPLAWESEAGPTWKAWSRPHLCLGLPAPTPGGDAGALLVLISDGLLSACSAERLLDARWGETVGGVPSPRGHRARVRTGRPRPAVGPALDCLLSDDGSLGVQRALWADGSEVSLRLRGGQGGDRGRENGGKARQEMGVGRPGVAGQPLWGAATGSGLGSACNRFRRGGL